MEDKLFSHHTRTSLPMRGLCPILYCCYKAKKVGAVKSYKSRIVSNNPYNGYVMIFIKPFSKDIKKAPKLIDASCNLTEVV